MITLKRLTPSDIGYFFHLGNDSENRKWMESEDKYTQDHYAMLMTTDVIHWYTIHDDEIKEDDKRVGLFTSYGKDDRLYIGIIIDPKHRRKGYAKMTFKHFLEAVDKINLPTYLGCFKDQPVLNMYKEVGFKELKEERKRIRGKMWITMKRDNKPVILTP